MSDNKSPSMTCTMDVTTVRSGRWVLPVQASKADPNRTARHRRLSVMRQQTSCQTTQLMACHTLHRFVDVHVLNRPVSLHTATRPRLPICLSAGYPAGVDAVGRTEPQCGPCCLWRACGLGVGRFGSCPVQKYKYPRSWQPRGPFSILCRSGTEQPPAPADRRHRR